MKSQSKEKTLYGRKTLQLADDIFISELVKDGYYEKVSQAFAVFFTFKTVKSVGVVGDSRRYEYVIASNKSS